MKELVKIKVVVKNRSKMYSLSSLWVSKIKQMEMSIFNIHENNWETEGVFGGKNPRIPSKYCFEEDHIAVNGISSILLPKAFLRETINYLNGQNIKSLSVKIAEYYFQSLEKSLPGLKDSEKICFALKSFNKLLQDFYWGSISFHAGKKGEIIYLKINSNNFSSKNWVNYISI